MSALNLLSVSLDEKCDLSRTPSVRSVRRKKKKGVVRKRSDCTYPVMNYCNDCREWFLRNVPFLKMIPEELLSRVVDIMIERHFKLGEIIKSQGERVNNIFIVAKGYAQMIQTNKNINDVEDEDEYSENKPVESWASEEDNNNDDDDDEGHKILGYLTRGDWFGDIFNETSTKCEYTVIAVDKEGVDCLVLERDAYHQMLKDVQTNTEINSDQREMRSQQVQRRLKQYAHLTLKDLIVLGTLGAGGFGKVDLVMINSDDTKTFALKQMRKTRIVEAKQQDHVMHEKNLLLQIDSDFIIRLYRTFKDRKYLYMMMEVCLGGELWTFLRERKKFDNTSARFYTGCMVAALSYLHGRHIIYRDIKPENMLLDHRGYIKLTDFGFAKRVAPDRKTWTFCGTPDYVAPEIIQYSGHDTACDYWSLGILIYELLAGQPPFIAGTYQKTYEMIMSGIDEVEFPQYISKDAQNIIKKLCRLDPAERLGYGGIGISKCFKHSWFSGFESRDLLNQTMDVPILPNIESSTDRGNFKPSIKEKDDDSEPDDDVSGWDKEF